MAEIADLTYNVVAFSEIMQMIWKRLNDHGKNWRHVYKSLVCSYMFKLKIINFLYNELNYIFLILDTIRIFNKNWY